MEFIQRLSDLAALFWCRRRHNRWGAFCIYKIGEAFIMKGFSNTMDHFPWAGRMSHYSLEKVEQLVESHPIEDIFSVLQQVLNVILGIELVRCIPQHFRVKGIEYPKPD